MKRVFRPLSFLLAVLFIFELFVFSGCSSSPSEPEVSPAPDAPVKKEFPVQYRMYSYERDDGQFFLDVVLTGDDSANFRVASCEAENRTDAFAYIAGVTVTDDGFSFTCEDEAMLCSAVCTEKCVDMTFEPDLSMSGCAGHYELAEVGSSLPEVPALPGFVPDGNTDGFEMDAVLAKGIREYTGLAPDALLTKEFLAEQYDLSIYDDSLACLTGIELMTSLHSLDIGSSCLSDISRITALTELTDFSFGPAYIKEIPDLSGLKQLTRLSIYGNMIDDLSPVADVPSLDDVFLCDNRITSIAPLSDVHSISMLNLNSNCVTDYDTVRDNKEIREALMYYSCDVDVCIDVEERAKQIVAEVTNDGMSELEKELALYRYVIENTEFSESFRDLMPFGYYGIMEKSGVCGDYSDELTMLCRTAGLDVISVSSSTHAWNMIKLDRTYYHMDSLWDDGDEVSYEHFNRSSENILGLSDHEHDLNKYPVAEDLDPLTYHHLISEE